jgi:hypothetical protein
MRLLCEAATNSLGKGEPRTCSKLNDDCAHAAVLQPKTNAKMT